MKAFKMDARVKSRKHSYSEIAWFKQICVRFAIPSVSCNLLQSQICCWQTDSALDSFWNFAGNIILKQQNCNVSIAFFPSKVQELHEEEAQWVNYDEDELCVKMQLADGIFEALIRDTVDVLNQINEKQRRLLLVWQCWSELRAANHGVTGLSDSWPALLPARAAAGLPRVGFPGSSDGLKRTWTGCQDLAPDLLFGTSWSLTWGCFEECSRLFMCQCSYVT